MTLNIAVMPVFSCIQSNVFRRCTTEIIPHCVEKTGAIGMPGKMKIIAYIVILTTLTIVMLQTLYRNFYETFPWSVNQFHTVKYKASLGFINPDSLTFWILLTGIILALIIMYFHPVEQEQGEIL